MPAKNRGPQEHPILSWVNRFRWMAHRISLAERSPTVVFAMRSGFLLGTTTKIGTRIGTQPMKKPRRFDPPGLLACRLGSHG